MEHPTKGFGKIITRVDNTRDVVHNKVTTVLPILNGKGLDINKTRAFSGDTGVDHVDGRLVITMNGGWTRRRETKVFHYGT